MKLSIVSTLYKSAPYLDEFFDRCITSAAASYSTFELVVVDDGSPDDSLQIAKRYAEKDSRIVVVELSRNFGHHRAILAGLEASSGDFVLLLDSDLEEPPECLAEFSKVMQTDGCDVVYGVHNQTEGSWLRRTTSHLFWRAFGFIGKSNTPGDICQIRLMTRAYVDALCSLPEKDVFLGGLYHWVGFKQTAVTVQRTIRRSISTYSFLSRAKLAFKAGVSFSNAPLIAMFGFGAAVSAMSALAAVWFLVNRLLHPQMPAGFTALIISVWFFGGLIIACLGLLGMYVGYIFSETKARPRTIVKKIHRRIEK